MSTINPIFSTFMAALVGADSRISRTFNGSAFTDSPLAQSFTTRATIDVHGDVIPSSFLNGVEFFFSGQPGTPEPLPNAYLCTDANGAPGVVVLDLGTLLAGNPSAHGNFSDGYCSYGIPINAAVSPNTRYWLKLDGSGFSAIWPGVQTPALGVNTAGELWSDRNGVYSANVGHGLFAMTIN